MESIFFFGWYTLPKIKIIHKRTCCLSEFKFENAEGTKLNFTTLTNCWFPWQDDSFILVTTNEEELPQIPEMAWEES